MRRRSGVSDLARGDRLDRGADVEVIGRTDMVQVPRVFLEEVLDAFNRLPNLRLTSDRWASTYGMAAALSHLLNARGRDDG